MSKGWPGVVLALDLATTTGWAYGSPGAVPQFGHERFSKVGGARALNYRNFRDWLDEFMQATKVDLIVYELPAVPSIMSGKTNIDTIKLLIGFAEHLEEWCFSHSLELREATVAQVRAHFIGRNFKSSIAKPMVFDACHARSWMCETTDESDACALWDYQCCWLDPQVAVRSTPLFRRVK